MLKESRKQQAIDNFMAGYNCSQSVFAAYADLFGIDRDTALKISSSFGAGMGRMREVCGTVSAMFMVAGMVTGCTTAGDVMGKKANYDVVQHLAEVYKERYGSIICRDLLGLKKDAAYTETMPDERTREYYKKRPCVRQVAGACDIIEEYLNSLD